MSSRVGLGRHDALTGSSNATMRYAVDATGTSRTGPTPSAHCAGNPECNGPGHGREHILFKPAAERTPWLIAAPTHGMVGRSRPPGGFRSR